MVAPWVFKVPYIKLGVFTVLEDIGIDIWGFIKNPGLSVTSSWQIGFERMI